MVKQAGVISKAGLSFYFTDVQPLNFIGGYRKNAKNTVWVSLISGYLLLVKEKEHL